MADCDEKCVSITWKFENISYFPEQIGEYISSPPFEVDAMGGTTWTIRIYPRGKEISSDYICVYLNREEDDSDPNYFEIKYQLAFIGKDGSVLKSGTCKYDFEESLGYGFLEFVKREEVYDTKRSIFLPEDTLTVRCRMWKIGETMLRDVRYFARTRIGVEKISFWWDLENFSSLESGKKISRLVKSPMNGTPLMSADLIVTGGVNCDEIIRFALSCQDKTIKYSTFRIFVINAFGNRVECNQEEFWLDEQRECEKFTFSFTRKKILANQRLFLPNDVLSLNWECAFSKGVVLTEIEDVQYGSTTSQVKISSANKVDKDTVLSTESLPEIVKLLYHDKSLWDVKLKTITGENRAHKLILSATSSVFKKMCDIMEYKGSKYIDVEDLDQRTVRRMLKYIYTSRVENLTWESATSLYEAANKYAILGLKNICSSYIINNLSTSNVSGALFLAENHADDEIKSAILEYLVKHGNELVNSEWRFMKNCNGKLVAEALYRLLYEN
ncbi:TD and POZ domain-containing protein 4 [Araneus ventricosus]|uniref:TD and POZ domain-containing protein 4 n=1 Tax=Araneus ventricosus TaxID=182803 RepID=A0A4Y2ETF2_ARAVE|nr:TD and POZ domain-containing protein 4 [Araneus ventricosus]